MEEKEIEIRGVKVRHMDREREGGRWENSRLKISFEGKIFQYLQIRHINLKFFVRAHF